MENINFTNVRDINIDSLDGLLKSKTISLLKNQGINNVEELLKFYDEGKLQSICSNNDLFEILKTSRLLLTKYFDIEPAIDINDTETNIRSICYEIGISVKATNLIHRYKIKNAKELFELCSDDDAFSKLAYAKGFGEVTIKEIKRKCDVIIEYNNRHSLSTKTLSDLYLKLEYLTQKKAELENEIYDTKLLIEQKKATIKSKVKVSE